MIFHIVNGDFAALPLRDALIIDPQMAGEVLVMKDVLSVGPLKKHEGQKFSEMRSEFWQMVCPGEKIPAHVDDLDRLLHAGNELSKNEQSRIWLWMAPLPSDICSYFWAQFYLKKYIGRLYVVNIAGLPFLDETGKIFYPGSIAEILPSELVKARRLARLVTPSESEADSEDWLRLVKEDGGIRVHESGKRISSKGDDYYDEKLVSFCSHQYQKATRIIGQAISKFAIPTGDVYLGWRLRKLAESGKLLLQGEVTKALKDFEVKLPG